MAVLRLLDADDPEPVGEERIEGRSPFFLICDHAGNAVPRALNRLGVSGSELERHIGYDPGALAVAQRLSRRLDAPLVYQRYSRLVIDANRLPSALASMPAVSDGAEVPGNAVIEPLERARRIEEILEPYHERIETRLAARREAGRPTVLVSLHSFTPRLFMRPEEARPWQVGVIWPRHDRFARRLLAELRQESALIVGENEPYVVDHENDYSLPVHGDKRGLESVEFELRQDLIATEAQAEAWAERLSRHLLAALVRAG